ncbi:MAG: uracil permease [Firmicutes bacterium]|nr:uracil permease [Bacillota bacterium]
MSKNVQMIDVQEKMPLSRLIPLGFQHLFAMFSATVLVPLLTGLSPAVALFTSGMGTLLFALITKGKIPAYLGSSFAFIAPIIYVSAEWGKSYALGATVIVGLVYALIAFIISKIGTRWIDRVLPPVVIGSVIIVIGLGLAGTAVDMAGLRPVTQTETMVGVIDGVETEIEVVVAQNDGFTFTNPAIRVSLFTLAVTIIASIFLKGFFAVIPILIGIIAGYLFALTQGIVDFSIVKEASWFTVPDFSLPAFNWSAILVLLPVSLVTIAEHLGDIMVISRVVGRDYFKDPGLHRTLLGDGLATALAGLFGGPPNTTYGENVGVLAITGVYSVWVVITAAVLAVLLSFFGKFGALIMTIPEPVMGGVSMVLFGIIASSGLRTLVESGVDFSDKRNLIISSVILVLGIGGAQITIGRFNLAGMALATIVGIILNLVLPKENEAADSSAA